MPTNADGLDTLLCTLSETQIDARASKLEAREFQLSVPKFKLASNYDLVAPLTNLGMERAFTAGAANEMLDAFRYELKTCTRRLALCR